MLVERRIGKSRMEKSELVLKSFPDEIGFSYAPSSVNSEEDLDALLAAFRKEYGDK